MSALGPDGPIIRLIDRLLRRHEIPYVVESGTQRGAALNWAVDGLNVWAPPHADDILTDVLLVWRGSAGTVTAGTLTLGKLEEGEYGSPVNQLDAADYDLAGLEVNTPTSLASLLGPVSVRAYPATDILQAEITDLDIGDDGFIALVPVFSRP